MCWLSFFPLYGPNCPCVPESTALEHPVKKTFFLTRFNRQNKKITKDYTYTVSTYAISSRSQTFTKRSKPALYSWWEFWRNVKPCTKQQNGDAVVSSESRPPTGKPPQHLFSKLNATEVEMCHCGVRDRHVVLPWC